MRSIRAAVALAVAAFALAGCSEASQPAATSNAPAVVQIAAGEAHSCALLEDGTVRCWGGNVYGQLGDGTTEDRWTPVEVSSLTGATAIAVGTGHTCAFLGDGTARCWGRNERGQLGNRTTLDSSIPVAVANIRIAATHAQPGATVLSARADHTCALLADWTVRCWGVNRYGQLGDQSDTDSDSAIAVWGLTTARSIAAGANHTCALLVDGSVMCWGRNEVGLLGSAGTRQSCTLGDGSGATPCATAPVWVPGVVQAEAIVAGDSFTCALLGAGVVSGWGSSSDGQLATAGAPGAYAGTPTSLPVWSVGTIAAGGRHACAIHLGGGVSCWGANDFGQLGHGTPEEHGQGAVDGLPQAISIAAGGSHTCAVTPGRGVRCWGQNYDGQLGDGTRTNRLSPVAVVGLDR